MEKKVYKFSKRAKIKTEKKKFLLHKIFPRNLNHNINFDHARVFERKTQKKEIFTKKFSNKLLFVNMNWKIFGAVDIYSLLKSLAPENGALISVSILSSISVIRKSCPGAIKNPAKGFFNGDQSFFLKNSDYRREKDYTFEKKIDPRFALVVCDSLKTSKKIFRTCNIIQIYGINDIISPRFTNDFPLTKFRKIDHADMIPGDYFPKFLNQPDHRKFFLKKVPLINTLNRRPKIFPHIRNVSKKNQEYHEEGNFSKRQKLTVNKMNGIFPTKEPLFIKKYLNPLETSTRMFSSPPEIYRLKKEIIKKKNKKFLKKSPRAFFF